MKISIVTSYTSNMKELGDWTSKINQKYCTKNNYKFIIKSDNDFIPERPSAWSKIKFMLDELKKNDWLMWIDADAIFINYSITIESLIKKALNENPKTNLIIKNDGNTGVWIIKNNKWTINYLNAVWNYDISKSFYWEMGAMNNLIDDKYVYYEKDLQNYYLPENRRTKRYKIPDINDYILHVIGGNITLYTNEKGKLDILKAHKNLIKE